jgi:hypothetical protein
MQQYLRFRLKQAIAHPHCSDCFYATHSCQGRCTLQHPCFSPRKISIIQDVKL